MSNDAFPWLPVAIAFLLAVEFLLLVVALVREMKKRFWYLPAGMVVGAIVGAIVGGPGVCHPGTATGILVGYIVGAAASSWRRSCEERL
jgi:ABC-type Na+ efflux pump permease subunit